MRQQLRNQEPAARGRATLPDPLYYLNNFQTVLSSIEERYAQLLSLQERQFMASFRALPEASRRIAGADGHTPRHNVPPQPIALRGNR